MKMPMWLKILILLILASIVFSALGAVSEFIVLPLVLLALILFPGKNPANPTLFKVLPYLWALNSLASLAFLIAMAMGKNNLLGPDARELQPIELWTTLLFTFPLMITFVKRMPVFRVALVLTAVIYLGIELWIYETGAQDWKAKFELAGSFVSELMIVAYCLKKFRPVPARRT